MAAVETSNVMASQILADLAADSSSEMHAAAAR
jgi:hypothetical protein